VVPGSTYRILASASWGPPRNFRYLLSIASIDHTVSADIFSISRMAEITPKPSFNATKPILIIGAGIAGLTLAQGCRNAGLPFQIFERYEESSERSQGWGLSIHWGLRSLERTIGPELSACLPEVCLHWGIRWSDADFK
jgi:hypothetical protein